nr:MAG: hypothetical protein OI719_00385 [Candidatus Methanoperedens sp.]
MTTKDESPLSHIDMNRFIQSAASKIGAGTLEIILVGAVAANYFGYININEPYYKYLILLLLGQTLGLPFIATGGTIKKVEKGVCPHCGVGYSIKGYECKTCGYEVPTQK